jgi:hypothetical protein
MTPADPKFAGLNPVELPGRVVLYLAGEREEQFVTRRRFTFATFRRKILA